MDFSSPPAARHALAPLGALLALTAALAWHGCRGPADVSPDARVAEAIGRHLLDNTTVGRQALVSSVWHPPLPVLLRLPVVAWTSESGEPLASIGLAALGGAAALLLVWRLARRWLRGWEAVSLAAAIALHPLWMRISTDGSHASLTWCLGVGVLGGLADWLETRRLGPLLGLAACSALLVLTRWEMTLWLLIVFLVLVADQALSTTPRAQQEAVLILALLPAAYAAGLWVLMNWLIMGDALYFLRSLTAAGPALEPAPLSRVFDAGAVRTTGLAGLMLLLASWGRSRAAVYTSLATLALPVVALFGVACGWAWAGSAALAVSFPLTVLATGKTASALRATRPRAAAAAVLLPVTLAAALRLTAWAEHASAATLGSFSSPRPRAAPPGAAEAELCERLRGHVLSRSPFVKVFVCGYDAFRLLGRGRDPVFVPSLDFNFNQARKDYHGQTLFVLVHRPEGLSAMDSIHWKYPGIHAWGHRSTLYDGDWGPWRLFEIIQAPTLPEGVRRRPRVWAPGAESRPADTREAPTGESESAGGSGDREARR